MLADMFSHLSSSLFSVPSSNISEIFTDPEQTAKEQAPLLEETEEKHWLEEVEGVNADLEPNEEQFFEDLIQDTLIPLKHSEKEQRNIKKILKSLMHNVTTWFFMLNSLVIVIMFTLQRNADQVNETTYTIHFWAILGLLKNHREDVRNVEHLLADFKQIEDGPC